MTNNTDFVAASVADSVDDSEGAEVDTMPREFFGNGDFEFISYALDDREYYRNAHWAITETNMWNWMRNFEPTYGGFTFSNAPNIDIISKKMYEQDIARGHSGASFGITMRKMETIAKYGYDNFRDAWIRENS